MAKLQVVQATNRDKAPFAIFSDNKPNSMPSLTEIKKILKIFEHSPDSFKSSPKVAFSCLDLCSIVAEFLALCEATTDGFN